MFRKKRRVPIAIKVDMIPNPHDTDKGYKKSFSLKFEIPPGGSYKTDRWTHKLSIYDVDGARVRFVEFQAGFTVSFSFIYWQPD